MIWVFSLVSVVVVSLISLVGVTTLSLIPATFRGKRADSLWPSRLVLAGMLLFFVVEKLLRHERGIPELAAINLFGDAIHNFMDGVMIGASYLASPTLGFSTTLAVVLHEFSPKCDAPAVEADAGGSSSSGSGCTVHSVGAGRSGVAAVPVACLALMRARRRRYTVRVRDSNRMQARPRPQIRQ